MLFAHFHIAACFLLIAGPDGNQDGCVVCHGAEGRQFDRSVHSAAAIGCVDCHGGDAGLLDKDAAHGADLRPLSDPRAAVEECAGCHSDLDRMRGFGLRTDQGDVYWTSHHGKGLAERGDPNVATCVSCHGGHGVFAGTDPRSPAHKFNQPATCGRCHSDEDLMDAYGLSSTAVEDYSTSVHGIALLQENHLSSPACTDCHGSHSAKPPQVEEVGRVCGHCHSTVLRYFEESPHIEPALEGEMGECTSCHDHHSVVEPAAEMLVGQGKGNCTICHRGEDEPARQVASRLYDDLNQLDSAIVVAEQTVLGAGSEGLFIEREQAYLEDARSIRARSRTLSHTLDPGRLADMLNRGQGMVDQTLASLDGKRRALRDHKIFTALFLGATLLLAGVLQTYRREVFESVKRGRDRTRDSASPERD